MESTMNARKSSGKRGYSTPSLQVIGRVGDITEAKKGGGTDGSKSHG
jgi:hypothetical protein